MFIFVKERILEWKSYSPFQFAIQMAGRVSWSGQNASGKSSGFSMAEYFPLDGNLQFSHENFLRWVCNRRWAVFVLPSIFEHRLLLFLVVGAAIAKHIP